MRKLLLAAVALLAVAASSVATAATTGRATHGVAYVGATHSEGKDLFISGDLKDSLLGRGAIVFVTHVGGSSKPGTVHVISRRVTIYTAAGSLQGSGAADEVITSSSVTVKNGTFSLTKGTGAYKGHTFKGTFGGPEHQGVYTFTYQAVYH